MSVNAVRGGDINRERLQCPANRVPCAVDDWLHVAMGVNQCQRFQ